MASGTLKTLPTGGVGVAATVAVPPEDTDAGLGDGTSGGLEDGLRDDRALVDVDETTEGLVVVGMLVGPAVAVGAVTETDASVAGEKETPAGTSGVVVVGASA